MLDRELRPSPDDRRPPSHAEVLNMMKFVEDEIPPLHQLLTRLQTRNPSEFDRSIRRMAPMLRQLQRIFRRSPDVGKIIVEHATNQQRIQRAARQWHERRDDRLARERLEIQIRRRILANLRLERRVIEVRVAQLVAARATRAATMATRLLRPDADIVAEPPEIRAVVEAWQATDVPAQRAWLQDTLAGLLLVRIDAEAAALRERLESMGPPKAEQVDAGFQQAVAEADPDRAAPEAPRRR